MTPYNLQIMFSIWKKCVNTDKTQILNTNRSFPTIQLPYTKCLDTLPILYTFNTFVTECDAPADYPPTGEYIHKHVQSRRILRFQWYSKWRKIGRENKYVTRL